MGECLAGEEENTVVTRYQVMLQIPYRFLYYFYSLFYLFSSFQKFWKQLKVSNIYAFHFLQENALR